MKNNPGDPVGQHFRRVKFSTKFDINNEKYIIFIESILHFLEMFEVFKNMLESSIVSTLN